MDLSIHLPVLQAHKGAFHVYIIKLDPENRRKQIFKEAIIDPEDPDRVILKDQPTPKHLMLQPCLIV